MTQTQPIMYIAQTTLETIHAMADVFIGYARLDRDVIEQLAAAIEAAGYSVWWDRQIIGGSEFSRDIERELSAAKAVVICWSQDASDSPWVRDEAAVARDQDKLVPVILDSEPPPMGFRQYQAVDFSGWDGQADHQSVADLLRAVESRIGGAPPALAEDAYTAPTPNLKRWIRPIAAAAIPVALITAYTVFHFSNVGTPEQPASTMADSNNQATLGDFSITYEPRIVVAPIKLRGGSPDLDALAATLSEDIASGLSRFSYLRVTAQLPDIGGVSNGAAYVLEGTLRRVGSTLRLSTKLVNLATNQQVWGETFDRVFDAQNSLAIQDDLTDHVVASVADPYGALMRDLSQAVSLKTPEEMTPYETILRHFIYRQRIGPEDHLVTRQALERGVEMAPGEAGVWSSLAAIYSEEYKHGYNLLPSPLDRALQAARRAIELEPDSAYANFALAEVYFFRQNLGAFRAAAERAISLNPRDSDAMAMIGIMMGYGGDWVRSVELTTHAMALNPNHPGWYRFNTFFNEYRQEHFQEALAIAQRINMPYYFADAYVRAMTHAQLGHVEQATRALDEFRKLWPGVNLRILGENHVNKWFFAQPDLIELVVEGLSKAGLEEGDL